MRVIAGCTQRATLQSYAVSSRRILARALSHQIGRHFWADRQQHECALGADPLPADEPQRFSYLARRKLRRSAARRSACLRGVARYSRSAPVGAPDISRPVCGDETHAVLRSRPQCRARLGQPVAEFSLRHARARAARVFHIGSQSTRCLLTAPTDRIVPGCGPTTAAVQATCCATCLRGC